MVVGGPAKESLDERRPQEERRNQAGSEEDGPLKSLFDEALYQQEGIREHVSSFPSPGGSLSERSPLSSAAQRSDMSWPLVSRGQEPGAEGLTGKPDRSGVPSGLGPAAKTRRREGAEGEARSGPGCPLAWSGGQNPGAEGGRKWMPIGPGGPSGLVLRPDPALTVKRSRSDPKTT